VCVRVCLCVCVCVSFSLVVPGFKFTALQTLCHSSHSPTPFCRCNFSHRVLRLYPSQPEPWSSCLHFHCARMTGVNQNTQLLLVDIGSQNFLSRLASNSELPYLWVSWVTRITDFSHSAWLFLFLFSWDRVSHFLKSTLKAP
jgi:hypothetical protein